MTRLWGKGTLLGVVGGGVLVLDQATKWWIQSFLVPHQSVPIIPGFFHLTYIQNPGAAFGLFTSLDPAYRAGFLIGMSLLAMGILGVLYWKMPLVRLRFRIPLAVILGGATGNLLDRLRYQRVVDFLDFFWDGYHWPSFNVADMAITLGTLSLVVATLWREERIPVAVSKPEQKKGGGV